MKKMLKGLFCISMLLSSIAVYGDTTFGKTFFTHRSQGSDTARELINWTNHIHLYDVDEFYGTFAMTPEYTRSFNNSKIAKYLFFNGKDTMHFGPDGANQTDVSSINFGLAPDFESDLTASPRVENFIFDLNLFLGFDNWVKGLYLKAYLPLTYTRWKVNLDETVTNKGRNTFTANEIGANTPVTVKSAKDAWKGNVLVGNIVKKWEYGKIDDARDNSKFRPADLELVLGWNLQGEKGFIGPNIRLTAPLGNKVRGEYFFEPMAGNNHWELGAGIIGKLQVWDNCDESLSFFVDATFSHKFGRTQKRAFDFKDNGVGSRYLLLKEFNNAGNYNNVLINAINVTTLDSKVKVNFKGDATLMANYRNGGTTLDFGYNIWGRSKEDVTIKENIPENVYGIYGINSANTGDNNTSSTTTIKQDNGADANPKRIDNTLLDVASGESPKAISHKIFGHVAYNWFDNEYSPFIGFGGMVEWRGYDNNALSQWGIEIKTGFDF